jgi:ribonuclease HI
LNLGRLNAFFEDHSNKAGETQVEPDKPKWKRMQFKKNKVWLAVDETEKPIEKNGKVLIKYQLDQPHEYWVRTDNIRPLNAGAAQTAMLEKVEPQTPAGGQKGICVFTDGASSGNPGPSGVGVVLRSGKHEKEISEYIGVATNNIAELKAIQMGLSALKNKNLPVRIFTDSRYAYGVLVLGWKARANNQLVESIKKMMKKFKTLEIVEVRGHAGDEGNERADFLATSAIKDFSNK